MRLFVDTNILVDFVCRREPFASDAKRLFAHGYIGDFELQTSALSFVNAMYIEKEGIGIINWNDNESVATDIINLLNYPMKLERMKRNMRKITNNLENTNILNTYLEEKIC